MDNITLKKISHKCCPRFGQIAVEFGYLSEAQVAEAILCQMQDGLRGRDHRLLGQILFEKDWMSAAQIDQVLTELFSRIRKEEQNEMAVLSPLQQP